MNKALILCDGAPGDPTDFEQVTKLDLSGPKGNLKATINELSHRLFQNLDSKLEDFLRIAAFIYGADGAIGRGSALDVYAGKWVRRFSFVIPVQNPDFWNQNRILEKLIECLSFLSDDQYEFNFIEGVLSSGQQMLDFRTHGLPEAPDADSILTISGGLDSLAGVIQSVKEDGLRPVLVGQWSAPKRKSWQNRVVEGLREKIPEWSFPWIGMWAHCKGWKPIERTQRCRSFLFLSLAAVCAKQAGLEILRMCDNGITTTNLPHTDATRGGFLTRSTHPKFLYLFQQLVGEVTGVPLIIENPLWNLTKADVVKVIAKFGCAELIQETCSCFHTVNLTTMQQHCGTCPQCVDRRFATEIAGLSDYDIPERYMTDIFVDSLKEGDMRTNAENYTRFALDVKGLSEDSFIEKYPAVYDCVLHLPAKEIEDKLRTFSQLHIRHSNEVWRLVEKKCLKLVKERMEGNLSDTSLIGMVFSNEIYSNLQERYVRKLGEIFSTGIPPAFQHKHAVNETQVQDTGESCLISARERLNRESPMIPFAGVLTKPDFSRVDGKDILFIEFKYPKDRSSLNRIHTEITSRILIYNGQGAYAFFVIYDPSRTIINDEQFRTKLEEYEKVWIEIVR
jgi:hypothetical protein